MKCGEIYLLNCKIYYPAYHRNLLAISANICTKNQNSFCFFSCRKSFLFGPGTKK